MLQELNKVILGFDQRDGNTDQALFQGGSTDRNTPSSSTVGITASCIGPSMVKCKHAFRRWQNGATPGMHDLHGNHCILCQSS